MKLKDLVTKKNVGGFVLGTLFGTLGIQVLTSKDAKKTYTKATAAALRAHKSVINQYTELQENCEDILADAKKINDERNANEVE